MRLHRRRQKIHFLQQTFGNLNLIVKPKQLIVKATDSAYIAPLTRRFHGNDIVEYLPPTGRFHGNDTVEYLPPTGRFHGNDVVENLRQEPLQCEDCVVLSQQQAELVVGQLVQTGAQIAIPKQI